MFIHLSLAAFLVQFIHCEMVEIKSGETKSISELLNSDGNDGVKQGTLSVGSISVSGTFNCSIANPERSLKIEMSGEKKEINAIDSGLISLMGAERTSWTRLIADVHPGDTVIEIEGAEDWNSGDELSIAPTGYGFDEYDVVTIVSRDGPKLTILEPLKFFHSGQYQKYHGKILESRAEVALLTRNLKIYGDASSNSTSQGAAIKIVGSRARGYFQDIELRYVGKNEVIGQYPIHWHNVHDANGQYARRVSVYKSFFRCFTIHCTDNVILEGNTCTDHTGHGFFLEDGAETGNIMKGNLGMVSRLSAGKIVHSDAISENQNWGVSTFWFINPNNSFVDNVAAGSQFSLFSMELTTELETRAQNSTTCANRLPKISDMQKLPLGKFEGNVGHSSDGNAFQFGEMYNPSDVAVFRNLQAYKIKGVRQGACIWAHGFNMHFQGFIFADFGKGIWPVFSALFDDGVFVGISSLPLETAVTAFNAVSVYDGPSMVQNTHFVNFVAPEGSPFTWVMHYDMFGGGDSSSKNAVSNVSFENPDYPKFSPSRACKGQLPGPSECAPGEERPFPIQIVDVDGSITGTPKGNVMAPVWRSDGSFYIDPLRNDDNCSPSQDGNMLYCGEGSSNIWGTLTLQDESGNPIPPETLPDLKVSVSNSKTAIVFPRNPVYGSQYEFNISPMFKYEWRYGVDANAKWPCFQIRLHNGYAGEKFHLSFVSVDSSYVPAESTEVGSIEALSSCTSSTCFIHQGGTLHILVQTLSAPFGPYPGFPFKMTESETVKVCVSQSL